MNVIEQTPSTGVLCWPAMWRWLIYLMFGASLTACSPMPVTPNLPEPAADLMLPAPTGLEVSQRATRNMTSWLEMLQGGPTK